MVNLKVRMKNKSFWLALIPALLILVQVVAGIFGYKIEIEGVTNQALAAVNALFAVLAILGIVNDPTTAGFSDSDRAMTLAVTSLVTPRIRAGTWRQLIAVLILLSLKLRRVLDRLIRIWLDSLRGLRQTVN